MLVRKRACKLAATVIGPADNCHSTLQLTFEMCRRLHVTHVYGQRKDWPFLAVRGFGGAVATVRPRHLFAYTHAPARRLLQP